MGKIANHPLYKEINRRVNELILANPSSVIAQNPTAKIPDDWVEFCKLLTIQSGNKFVPFVPYDFQIELYNAIENNSVTLVVKSRQMGFSQVVLSIILFKAVRNPAYKALILSKNGNDTSLLAKRMREMINCLKEQGMVVMENDNLQHLSILGGGKIYLLNSKPSAGRGIDSVSDILYDEAAFVDQMELTFSANDACQAMVGEEAKTIILSTPNGSSGWYYDKFISDNPHNALDTLEQIRSGQIEPVQQWVDGSGWCKFIAHWKAHPIYQNQPNYLANIAERKKMAPSAVKQEYDLSFSESAEMVFNPMMVREVCVLDELTKEYELNYDYYITLDTATMGNDYVVCNVLKYDHINNHYEQVDMYRKRHETSDYHIYQVSQLIEQYNPLIVGIEVTGGVGQLYMEKLQQIFNGVRFKAIKTTAESKPAMISKLLLLFEQKKISLLNHRDIVKEFLSFQRIDNKMGAVSGSHDDIVMAIAFSTLIIPEFDANPFSRFDNARIIG